MRVKESLKAEIYHSLGIRDSSYYFSKLAYEGLPQNAKHYQQYIKELVYRKDYDKINEIFVNQGPGKISSIRNSIAIAKGIAFAKNIDLYGFFSKHLANKDLDQLVKIDKKNFTNINLIKPLYSS